MTGKLTNIEGIAVPLLWDNVDTDALVPAAPHKIIGGAVTLAPAGQTVGRWCRSR